MEGEEEEEKKRMSKEAKEEESKSRKREVEGENLSGMFCPVMLYVVKFSRPFVLMLRWTVLGIPRIFLCACCASVCACWDCTFL